MADETVKQENKQLTLVIVNQLAEHVQFKVKLNTKFEKMFAAYQEKKGVTGYKFLYDGQRVEPKATPAELEMEDGDQIDAMLEQLGGCWLRVSHKAA